MNAQSHQLSQQIISTMASDERASKRAKLAIQADEDGSDEAEEDGVDGNAAITFRLLVPGNHGAHSLTEAGHFHPEMCHQVFGDSERITGFDEVPDFSVDIWISQTNYAALVEVPSPPPLARMFKSCMLWLLVIHAQVTLKFPRHLQIDVYSPMCNDLNHPWHGSGQTTGLCSV